MIYVCIPSYNEAPTVGLLLWKIRQVFAGVPARVPAAGARRRLHRRHRGGARAVHPGAAADRRPPRRAAGLRRGGRGAAARGGGAHRPSQAGRARSSCTPISPTIRRPSPTWCAGSRAAPTSSWPKGRLEGEPSRARRWLRRFAPLLLRGVVTVPGVQRPGLRLRGLPAGRRCGTRSGASPTGCSLTDGWAANAELYWRAARHARRVETVTVGRAARPAAAGRAAGQPWAPRSSAVGARGGRCAASPVPPAPPEPPARARSVEAEAVSS